MERWREENKKMTANDERQAVTSQSVRTQNGMTIWLTGLNIFSINQSDH